MMESKLKKYHDALESDSTAMKEWALLHLAAAYQYGWFDIPIDYDKALRYYNNMIESGCYSPANSKNSVTARSRRILILLEKGLIMEAFEDVLELMRLSDGAEPDIINQALEGVSNFLADGPCSEEVNSTMMALLFQALERIDTRNASAEKIATAYYRLGRRARFAGKPRFALRMQEKALEFDDPETNPWSNFEIGRMHINPKKDPCRLKTNLRLAKKYLKKVPDDAPRMLLARVYCDLSWIEFVGYGLKPGSSVKALEYCDKAIELGAGEWASEMRSCIVDYQKRVITKAAKDVATDTYLNFIQSL